MNRYKIKDIASNQIIAIYEAEAPMEHHAEWGTLEQTITEYIEGEEEPQVTVIPQSYEVIVEDMTDELRLADIKAYSDAKSAECEAAVSAVLAPSEDVTHLMLSLFDMYIAMNVAGNQAQEEIDAAKSRLNDAITLMGQIQALRAARDADIAAYEAAHSGV